MKMPQNNPDGYRTHRAALRRRRAAGAHAAHSRHDGRQRSHAELGAVRLRAAESGKPFEMMVYARQRHGFTDPLLIKHLQQLTYDFVMRNIGIEAGRAGGAGPTARSGG